MNSFNQLKKNFANLAQQLGLQDSYKSTGKQPEVMRKYNELLAIQNLRKQIQAVQTIQKYWKSKKHFEEPEIETLEDLIDYLTNNYKQFPVFIDAHCLRDTGEAFFIKREFKNLQDVEYYENYLLQQGSDVLSIKIVKLDLHKQGGQVINYARIKRSNIGQGDDLHDIQEHNDENLYIPTSNDCLKKVLSQYYQENNLKFPENLYKEFCIQHKIIRDRFPQCKLGLLSQKLGIYICPYDAKKQQIKYNNKNKKCDIVIYIHDNHYLWIKKDLSPTYKKIGNHYVKTVAKLDVKHLSTIVYLKENIKFYDTVLDQLKNVYVWDLEAYHKGKGTPFKEYSCGYTNIMCCQDKNAEIIENSIEKYTNIFDSESYINDKGETVNKNCIVDMCKHVDKFTKKTKTLVKNKKTGKSKIVDKKTDVHFYAHNGKGFDHFFVLQQAGLKFKRMIKPKGIINSLVVEMENCNIHFKCTASHLNGSLKKLCKTFKVPENLRKSELEFEEINENNWKQLEHKWKPYLRLDIISLGFVWRKYIETMNVVCEGVSIKDHITLPSLVWSYAMMKNNKVELRSFDHPFMQQYLRKFVHGGRVVAYRRKFRSSHLEDLKILLKRLFDRDFIQKYVELQEYSKIKEIREQQEKLINSIKDLDNITDLEIISNIMKPVYVKINEKEELNQQDQEVIQKAEILKNFKMTDYLMAFDATSLYPSAMVQIKRFPDISTAYIASECEKEHLLKTGSLDKQYLAVIDYFIPQSCKFSPLADKKDGLSIFHTGIHKQCYHCDLDIQQIYRFGGHITKIYDLIIFKESIENPFKETIELLFKNRQEAKQQDNSILDECYKLCMNSTFGKTVQKPILEGYKFTTQQKFKEVYDHSIVDYDVLNNGQICYKKQHSVDENPYPAILGVYILAQSKKIINDFVLTIKGDINNYIYYSDTDSLYIHSDLYDILKQNNYVVDFQDGVELTKEQKKIKDPLQDMGRGKNDYGTGGIVYADFVGAKQKMCYVLTKEGYLLQKLTFKGIGQKNLSETKFSYLQCQLDLNFKSELTVTEKPWQRTIKNGVIFEKEMDKIISCQTSLKKLDLDNNRDFTMKHYE